MRTMPRPLPNTVFLVLVSKSEGEIPLEDDGAVCGIKEAAVINLLVLLLLISNIRWGNSLASVKRSTQGYFGGPPEKRQEIVDGLV
jgi:hypothetical protein